MTDRRRAQELAAQAIAAGRATQWFEQLYQESQRGEAIVPWDDRIANPLLVQWLGRNPRAGCRVLDVGTGTGDNAAELARRGHSVTAFDISATAIATAKQRFGDDNPRFLQADACALPSEFIGAFDLVVEIYTLQVLPPALRGTVARSLAACVAPGGTLLVICRARLADEPTGHMPFPLLQSELERLFSPQLALRKLDVLFDAEVPPVRRIVAEFVPS